MRYLSLNHFDLKKEKDAEPLIPVTNCMEKNVPGGKIASVALKYCIKTVHIVLLIFFIISWCF